MILITQGFLGSLVIAAGYGLGSGVAWAVPYFEAAEVVATDAYSLGAGAEVLSTDTYSLGVGMEVLQ